MEQIPAFLAQNVLALRRARKMTQASLARLAEVPRSTITYIESGEGNPSLKNLCKVSAALQVSIEVLLSRPRSDCMLIKAGDIAMESRGGGTSRLFKLLPDKIPGMEIDRMEIEPGGKLPGMPHLEHTKEYLTCVQGEVLVTVAGERFQLTPGDVLAFPGNRPHSYHNSGSVLCITVSVVTLAFGAGPSGRGPD